MKKDFDMYYMEYGDQLDLIETLLGASSNETLNVPTLRPDKGF